MEPKVTVLRAFLLPRGDKWDCRASIRVASGNQPAQVTSLHWETSVAAPAGGAVAANQAGQSISVEPWTECLDIIALDVAVPADVLAKVTANLPYFVFGQVLTAEQTVPFRYQAKQNADPAEAPECEAI